jgi:signal peptidase II
MSASPKLPLGLMALLLAMDQGSKAWVRAAVPIGAKPVPLIPNFIDLTHVSNAGVSFSFLADLPGAIRAPLLAGVSLVAAALIGAYWVRHRTRLPALAEAAFVLILPGAVGNLIDRAWFGAVTDFFHFRIFDASLFVNNAADIFISVGVGCYLLAALLEKREPPAGAPGGSKQRAR